MEHQSIKQFVLVAVSLLLALSLASFASAALTISNPISIPANVSHDSGSFQFSFNLTNAFTEPTTVSFTDSKLSSGSGSVSISPVTLSNKSSQIVTGTANFAPNQNGQLIVEITAKSSNANDTSAPLTYNLPTVQILDSYSLAIAQEREITASQNGSVKVTNTGNQPLNNIALSNSAGFNSVLAISTLNLNPGASQVVAVSPASFSAILFGSQSTTVKAYYAGQNLTAETAISAKKTFCALGKQGSNLSITNIAIETDGDSKTKWKLIDNVKVTAKIKHSSGVDIDVENIIVELGLFNSAGENVASDLNFKNKGKESIEIGDLSKNKDEEATFDFVVSEDLSSGDYKLAIKAYSDDTGETVDCIDTATASELDNLFYKKIQIENENDRDLFMRFTSPVVSPQPVLCGETATLSTNVINVGNRNQDRVKVTLVNAELGINMFQELKSGLDKGDSKDVLFTLTVPKSAQNKDYDLLLGAEYTYDDTDGTYGDLLKDPKKVLVKVAGCAGSSADKIATISTKLDSDVSAGKELSVTATVKNLGSSTADFVVSARGFESWGSLTSPTGRILTLGAGESKTVTFTFSTNKDAVGEKNFLIETLSAGKSASQEVAIDFGKSSSWTSSWLVWTIIGVNVILVVLIIIVAVRLARR